MLLLCYFFVLILKKLASSMWLRYVTLLCGSCLWSFLLKPLVIAMVFSLFTTLNAEGIFNPLVFTIVIQVSAASLHYMFYLFVIADILFIFYIYKRYDEELLHSLHLEQSNHDPNTNSYHHDGECCLQVSSIC